MCVCETIGDLIVGYTFYFHTNVLGNVDFGFVTSTKNGVTQRTYIILPESLGVLSIDPTNVAIRELSPSWGLSALTPVTYNNGDLMQMPGQSLVNVNPDGTLVSQGTLSRLPLNEAETISLMATLAGLVSNPGFVAGEAVLLLSDGSPTTVQAAVQAAIAGVVPPASNTIPLGVTGLIYNPALGYLSYFTPGGNLVGAVGSTVQPTQVISLTNSAANSPAIYLNFIESTEGECRDHVVMLDLSGSNL